MTNEIADGDDCYGVAFGISQLLRLMMITENTEQNKVTLSQRMLRLIYSHLTYAPTCSSLVVDVM